MPEERTFTLITGSQAVFASDGQLISFEPGRVLADLDEVEIKAIAQAQAEAEAKLAASGMFGDAFNKP